MIRAAITLARQRAKAIMAAVPGIDASFIDLGVVAPEEADDDADFFKVLRAKTPTTMTIVTSALTFPLFAGGAITVDDMVFDLAYSTASGDPFYVKIGNEIIKVLNDAGGGAIMSIERGQFGTTPAIHADMSAAALFEVATITLDSDHSFTAGQKLVLSVGALDFDYAIALLAVTPTTLVFENPQTGASSPVTIAEGDLVYTIKIVVKAAVPTSFDVRTQLSEYNVEVLIYFGIEYASQTFISLESLVIFLRDALALSDNWANLNDGPDDPKMDEPRLMRKDNPVPGYYKITLPFSGI